MIKVNYPEPEFRFKLEEGREMIFDSIRKQWVNLSEEEWVRQNFIQFLIHDMKYPVQLIAVEREIKLGELKKRFDILIYDKNHKPWMLIECKKGEVKLDERAFNQIIRYHISVPASFLVITNGHYTAGWEKNNDRLVELDRLPTMQ